MKRNYGRALVTLGLLLAGCTMPWEPVCDTFEWESTPGFDAAYTAHYEALGFVCAPSEWQGIAIISCTTC